MPINTEPIFETTPKISSVLVSASSTRDGAFGTLFFLCRGTTFGTYISNAWTVPANFDLTTHANVAGRLYITGASGASPVLWKESLLNGIVNSPAQMTYPGSFIMNEGTILTSDKEVWCGQGTWGSTADNTNFFIETREF